MYDEEKEYGNDPQSQSNVTMKLADIQRRCSQLLEEPDALEELSLEDPPQEPDLHNPYDRG